MVSLLKYYSWVTMVLPHLPASTAISEIVINCKVKELSVSGNKSIGEGNKIYSIIGI